MQTYISILRGINVSGQKKILMTDLTKLYEDLGFKNVMTYIQSGNVLFKTDKILSDVEISDKIGHVIHKKYGFEVPVLVRTVKEMEKVIKGNPFKNETAEGLHVTFLSEKPSAENSGKLKDINFPPDRFIFKDTAIYLAVSSYGNTKLSNNFFENKLKVTATTRNWKTVNMLVELANNL